MLSREALDKATQLEPLFPPAYRLAISRLGERGDLDTAARDRAAQALIDRAKRLGPPGFALELEALRFATKQLIVEAIAAYEESFTVRSPSPEPAMNYASQLEKQGNQAKFEQTLGRLIRDYPTYGPAYLSLILHHRKAGGSAQAALNTLQRWRAADPSSTTARLVEAQLMANAGQTRDMLRRLTDLINENPQDAAVVSDAADTLRAAKQTQALAQTLEEQLTRNPKNVLLAVELIQTYREINRADDAVRIVEKVRTAAEGDSRMMYLVATLYGAVNQKEKSRNALAESLRLDPTDAVTNNDLGYTWAEEGINLDRAEAMTRRAVEAEPDNGSFLDSLGWVLYKRGEFDEARRHLERALAVGDDASMPVVLDHLGDTLYRLNDSAAAQAQWQKSLERLVLTPNRVDTEALRPVLEGKIRQAQMGEPVKVSPVSIEPRSASPSQAKN
ncbi:MAG: tetratricopeptide repeat protein [Anaerolineae bacterium]|nr:tetratricopeptide repeat protein [Phycisphaerae bacterium]